MQVKVTSKRQVTFPEAVLQALGAKPGSHLELQALPEGFLLRARSIEHDKLAPLKGKLDPRKGPFDLQRFREQSHDPSLRD